MSTKALSVQVIDAQNFKVSIPPDAQTYKELALSKASKILVVTNADQQTKAIQAVAILKGLVKEVEKLRKEVKQPFWDAGQAVDQKAKEYNDDLLRRISEIESLVAGFQRKERDRIEAAEREERRKRQEAEAAAQRERDRLAEIERNLAAAKTKKERERLALEQQQAQIDAAEAQDDLAAANVPKDVVEAPAATGAAVHFGFEYKVTDIDALAAWDIQRRQEKPQLPRMTRIEPTGNLRQFVNIVGSNVEIPGIEVFESTKTAVRSVSPALALE